MAADSKPKVLVIDDERGPRESLRILLKNEYEIFTADNVDQGVALLKEKSPDVVVLDIRMPDKNGIQGLKEIRAIDEDVAAIILTGFGELETAQEAIRHGASEYLKKPFDAPEMMKVIARNVERTHMNKRRNSAEKRLLELDGELKNMLGEKEQMASLGLASSAFAHDLRNPLMVVLAYVEMLALDLRDMGREGNTLSEDIEGYIEGIEKNVNRCNKLAKDWNLLGKPDAIEFQPISLNSVMNEIVADAKLMAKERDVEIEIEDTPVNIKIKAEPSLLERAFWNLAKNAIQAAELADNGQVRVDLKSAGNEVEVNIYDNGPGISPDKMESIFEPLKSGKKIGDGFGLGLFITKEVIEKHDGRIVFDSKPNKGTHVTINLPIISDA